MKSFAILALFLLCSPARVLGQEASDVEEQAATVLALAIESSGRAIEHMRSYVELVTGLDPDDQETRLTLMTMAVASAARATAFFEVYNNFLAISETQPSPTLIRSVGAMERAMIEIPGAGAEVFAGEIVSHVPVEEIRERVHEIDLLLVGHYNTLRAPVGPIVVASGGFVPSLTAWQESLADELDEDTDALLERFAGIVNEQGASTDDVTDLAFEAGRLAELASALRAVETILRLSDTTRDSALEDLFESLLELGDEIAEDLLGMTPEELQAKASSDEVMDHLEVLRNGAWRAHR